MRMLLQTAVVALLLRQCTADFLLTVTLEEFEDLSGRLSNGGYCQSIFRGSCDFEFDICIDFKPRASGNVAVCDTGEFVYTGDVFNILSNGGREFHFSRNTVYGAWNNSDSFLVRNQLWNGFFFKTKVYDFNPIGRAGDIDEYAYEVDGSHLYGNVQYSHPRPAVIAGPTVFTWSYKVYCLPGYSGPQCSLTNKPSTTPRPGFCERNGNLCRNGGSCVDEGTVFKCHCPPSYTGDFCENLITTTVPPTTTPSEGLCEMLGFICANAGTCVDVGSSFECECRPGYSGKFCRTYSPPTTTTTTTQPPNYCSIFGIQCLNNGTCTSKGYGFQCMCPPGFIGEYCQTKLTTPAPPTTSAPIIPYQDCGEYFKDNYVASGIYPVTIKGVTFKVYCRMTAEAGYTVIQRRVDDETSFNRTWAEYSNGFGKLERNFYLGNKYINLLTDEKFPSLVVSLASRCSTIRIKGTETYPNFRIATEKYAYRIYLSGSASGTAGDSMSNHVNFTINPNCAGGWWFGGKTTCGPSNLNGVLYPDCSYARNSLRWDSWELGHAFSATYASLEITN